MSSLPLLWYGFSKVLDFEWFITGCVLLQTFAQSIFPALWSLTGFLLSNPHPLTAFFLPSHLHLQRRPLWWIHICKYLKLKSLVKVWSSFFSSSIGYACSLCVLVVHYIVCISFVFGFPTISLKSSVAANYNNHFLVLKGLISELVTNCDGSLKTEVTNMAAHYEHRIHQGNKAIYHLEAFVAKFMSVYKRFLEEGMADFF